MDNEILDEKFVRRKVMTQGVNILRAIIESYHSGIFDDPKASMHLCSLFALIAEGKVIGHFDSETASTKWTLSEDYMKRLQEIEDDILQSKILKGPWKNSLDPDVNT